MEGIEKAIKKYCRVTVSVFTGYDNGYFYFMDNFGVEKSYSHQELLREVRNFE